VGAGATPEQALKAIGSTVEGTANTRAALALASKLMIDLPTARTVDILLREEIAGEEGFQRLLALFAMALSSSIAAPST
jgi:glycerol-3-phosphate dehydrogenase